MAELNRELVQYLSSLARIACSDEETEALLEDLKKIVTYVEQLGEVDTSGVEPCFWVTEALSQTPLRKDIPASCEMTRKEFLEGTPRQVAGLVSIPPVLTS